MFRMLSLTVALLAAPAAIAAPLAVADKMIAYRTIVTGQIHDARAGAKALVKALEANDMAGAKAAWIEARQGWERSETVTGPYFPALDKAIDAWPTGATGFHAMEGQLFNGGDPKALLPLAKGLAENLGKMEGEMAKAGFDVQGLYNGMAGLAYEVGESKSKGTESKASGTSLNDLRNNVHAVVTIYDTVFAEAIKAQKPDVDAAVRKQIALVQKQIDVKDMSQIDQRTLEKTAEMLAVIFVDNAPAFDLKAPTLESDDD